MQKCGCYCSAPATHPPTMDRIWMKEKMHKCSVLVLSRPFFVLILLIVVMSTILRIITPSLLLLCSLSTATCVALRTGELLGFASRTGRLPPGLDMSKENLDSSYMQAPRNWDHALDTRAPPLASLKYRFVQSLQQVSVFAKRHALSESREEDFNEEAVEDDKLGVASEHLTNSSRVNKVQVRVKNGLTKDPVGMRDNSEPVVCISRPLDMVVADGKVKSSRASDSQYEGEVGGVPQLEDCTISEDEEVFKRILETTAHASVFINDVVANAILQPPNVSEIAANVHEEHSIDKHQILPLECCKKCQIEHPEHMDTGNFPCVCICNVTYKEKSKLRITDAELQDAASEFYTLEGDVLWSEADIKKQSRSAGDPVVVPTACEFCKQEGKISQTFSILPLKTHTGAKTFARMPIRSKVVYYIDAKRTQDDSGSEEESVRTSAEELNEDATIEKELRAITSRCGNKGEESNYMSTAGSFRDYVGSFREFDTFWPDYDITESNEDEYFSGCCDNHVKPCISHSRSRSKVLQTDPLLSKASLIREQEIMDVLWQEYNEDRRHKHYKQQREISQKQRSNLGVDGNGSNIGKVLNEGSTAESFNALQNDYVMKFNGAADDHEGNSCRFGYDKPCWAKTRSGYQQRRRHLVGFCRLFREFGLKQCMQSSKVDN